MEISGEGSCDSPRLTLCYKEQRKLLNVCLREREREINWVSGESFQQSPASIKLRRRPPIRWQKERKKGTRIMTERESRMIGGSLS